LEKENSAWNGLAPTITIWYEQEIGFIRVSIRQHLATPFSGSDERREREHTQK
jgi:hypothetical protein